MKEEKQNPQKTNSLWSRFSKWLKAVPLHAKVFFVSFLILILGYIFINNSDNKNITKALEESRKKTDEKLRAISLHEGRLDGYQSEINDLESKIEDTNLKIDKITAEQPEKTSLDGFFDKRV
jgi:hypothetical protein